MVVAPSQSFVKSKWHKLAHLHLPELALVNLCGWLQNVEQYVPCKATAWCEYKEIEASIASRHKACAPWASQQSLKIFPRHWKQQRHKFFRKDMKAEQKHLEKNVKRSPLRTWVNITKILAKVVTKRLKATIGTSNCKICFTQAVIRKAYLPTIDIPENSPDFQHFATICIYIYNIPQIKSPMLQTYVSWGVVQVCLMDDSKLKEPGSPHWPTKQLRGMRLKICLLEGQVTICNALWKYIRNVSTMKLQLHQEREKCMMQHTKKKILIGGQGAKSNLNGTLGAWNEVYSVEKWHSNA